ncbi:LOW QUALITY PROTEIN: hypothetical protein RJ639_008313 [Escallonia herrerae]|uniref:Disease resistance RPP13-like protein 1 n=1 Tax=Escallonia herrerae TaxID=1293975 RepID=A0AA88VVW5_9ASTE|nr:LOW QUALITY PROTEIN: hypothetical protein RJ639_008313 [Escallonia herrerae]
MGSSEEGKRGKFGYGNKLAMTKTGQKSPTQRREMLLLGEEEHGEDTISRKTNQSSIPVTGEDSRAPLRSYSLQEETEFSLHNSAAHPPCLELSYCKNTTMVVIAEIFLSAFFPVLFDKLASGELVNLALPVGIYSQLQTWSSKLKIIEAVLSDAEEKQIAKKSVNRWLEQLQDLAYDLDDLLDEMATEALRRKMMAQPTQASNPSMLRKLIPACCSTNFTPRAVKLEDLLKQRSDLNLTSDHLGAREERETKDRLQLPWSMNILDFTAGKKINKQYSIKMSLGCESGSDHRFRVIPIVGMGGIGKTSLAQQIYNDEEVKNSFDLKAWICISDEFDEFAITERIYKAISSERCEFKDLNMVQVKLREIISNKKFLLVLDDVWNEN